MDNNTATNVGGIGFIALFLLILFALFSGGSFFGNRCGGYWAGDCGNALGYGWHSTGDIRASICASEKQNIIDSARTHYLIEQQGAETRSFLGNKMDYYEQQHLRDKVQELSNKNMFLENQILDERRYNMLSNEIANIRSHMLTKPEVRGVGYVCEGTLVPSNLIPNPTPKPATV